MRFLPLILLTFLCYGADAPPAFDPKLPSDAASLLIAYDKDIAKIQSDADVATALRTEKLRGLLLKAQESATKKGDLDAALAVKGEIEKLKKPVEQPKKPSLSINAEKMQAVIKRGVNATEWDSMPGDVLTVKATAALPADFHTAVLIVPHPTDTWSNGVQPCTSEGNGKIFNGMSASALLIVTGDDNKEVKKGITTPAGAVTLRMNDGDLSNNTGFIRVKICPIQ